MTELITQTVHILPQTMGFCMDFYKNGPIPVSCDFYKLFGTENRPNSRDGSLIYDKHVVALLNQQASLLAFSIIPIYNR